MTAQLALYAGAAAGVAVGGTAVTAIYGPVSGGLIVNPALPIDQGLAYPEFLYVDLAGTAGTTESGTTRALFPGEALLVPASTKSVSVNAASSGHRFTALFWQPPTQYPPMPDGATFPPAGPTTVQAVLPSYLYEEYFDDDDLQAFVAAFNQLAQEFVDWFNALNLPVYSSATIVGALLDWVAVGLYGMARPTLPAGTPWTIGPLGTYALGTTALGVETKVGSGTYYVTTDDIFKRILTWHLYKGDGKLFNVRWLKRRIMRFLTGTNGAAGQTDQTYQVSVTFGGNGQVNVRILNGIRTLTGGAIPGRFALGTTALGAVDTTWQRLTPLTLAPVLQAGILSGALETPFMQTYDVTIV